MREHKPICRLRFDFLQNLFWFMDTEIFIVALASTVHVTEKKGWHIYRCPSNCGHNSDGDNVASATDFRSPPPPGISVPLRRDNGADVKLILTRERGKGDGRETRWGRGGKKKKKKNGAQSRRQALMDWRHDRVKRPWVGHDLESDLFDVKWINFVVS